MHQESLPALLTVTFRPTKTSEILTRYVHCDPLTNKDIGNHNRVCRLPPFSQQNHRESLGGYADCGLLAVKDIGNTKKNKFNTAIAFKNTGFCCCGGGGGGLFVFNVKDLSYDSCNS